MKRVSTPKPSTSKPQGAQSKRAEVPRSHSRLQPPARPKSGVNNKYSRKVRGFGRKTKAVVLILGLALFGTGVLLGTFDVVRAGTVRIAVEPSGRVVGPVEPGWHFGWCNPFSQKYEFRTTVQTIALQNMHADTLDGHVNIDLTVTYRLRKENVTQVFERYGPNYQSAITPVVTSAFRDAFSNNTMRAVALENRSQVQQVCRESIESHFVEFFVEFLMLKVQNIALPGAFSQAQIQTQIAYEHLRATNITRDIQLLEATTAAEVAIITSEALANATIIRAESTAAAINLTIHALNVTGNFTETQLLTYLYIQELSNYAQYGDVILVTDGSIPVIILPSNSTSSP